MNGIDKPFYSRHRDSLVTYRRALVMEMGEIPGDVRWRGVVAVPSPEKDLVLQKIRN